MIYSPFIYRGFGSPFYNPYYGYGGFGMGGYGIGINSIGSQFSSQSLVNTGTYSGSNQIQSPTNIWG
jgi:hypothetical protein